MLKLCVVNSTIMDVCSSLLSSWHCMLYTIPSASYPLLRHKNYYLKQLIHLDDVDCEGNENMLSECSHLGIGIHHCSEEVAEAGVICTGM